MPSPTVTSAAEVQALFDRIAPHYDRLNSLLSLGLHQIWKEMAVTWAKAPVGGTVLDLCCGSGDLAWGLARRVGPQGQVVGVDLSAALLAIAPTRSGTGPKPTMTWQQGDVLTLPFADNHFDAITMGYGLRNVVDIPACLAEATRVLAPGAWLSILDFQALAEPTPAWLRWLQEAYLAGIVVPAARRLGLEAEYRYIQESLVTFPDGPTQQQLAIAAGLTAVRYYDLAGGLMGALVAQKPPLARA